MAVSNDAHAQGFALLIVRLVLGLLMLYYGLQDVFGLMGGEGLAAASQEFAESFGVMAYVGQIAIIGELIAGLFLILGFLTRVAAGMVAVLMAIGAAIGVKTTETLVKTTSEDPLAAVGYPTTLVVMSFVLILLGGGLLALDSKLFPGGKTTNSKAQEA